MKKVLIIVFAILYYASILMICYDNVDLEPYVYVSYIGPGFDSMDELSCWHSLNLVDANTCHDIRYVTMPELIVIRDWTCSADHFIDIQTVAKRDSL